MAKHVLSKKIDIKIALFTFILLLAMGLNFLTLCNTSLLRSKISLIMYVPETKNENNKKIEIKIKKL